MSGDKKDTTCQRGEEWKGLERSSSALAMTADSVPWWLEIGIISYVQP